MQAPSLPGTSMRSFLLFLLLFVATPLWADSGQRRAEAAGSA